MLALKSKMSSTFSVVFFKTIKNVLDSMKGMNERSHRWPDLIELNVFMFECIFFFKKCTSLLPKDNATQE